MIHLELVLRQLVPFPVLVREWPQQPVRVLVQGWLQLLVRLVQQLVLELVLQQQLQRLVQLLNRIINDLLTSALYLLTKCHKLACMSHNLGNGIHMTVKGNHDHCVIKKQYNLPSTTGSAGGGGSSSLTS